jgi:hypothetical protein
MSWIKRNLYFVVGSLVAVALMVLGGFYLLSAISSESDITAEIAKQYGELDRLNKLNPHPGSGLIDNVKAAKDQEQVIRAFINKARPNFERVTAIPDSPKVGKEEFAAQLRNTIAQLTRAAGQGSVTLPRDYQFTFESQRRLMNFDPGSLDKLAVHLGEIKAICEVLFRAKINSLDGVRRELVSVADDKNPTDYISQKTASTPLADLTPYEVSFRCFSAELAGVLSGLASSPHCFIVKTLNVEPAPASADSSSQPVAVQPVYTPLPVAPPAQAFASEGFARRYGAAAGMAYTGLPAPVPAPVASGPAPNRGPVTFLNEHQLRVTLMIEVVKLKAAK